jgi:uncharacterized protein (UPF0332 family)
MPTDRASELLVKAVRAVKSARLLAQDGDLDGACNRSYCAIFDAARSALMQQDPKLDPQFAKTHSGLMALFNERLVKPGSVSRDIGRLLKRGEELRVLADYTLSELTLEEVSDLVESAQKFVAAMKEFCDAR